MEDSPRLRELNRLFLDARAGSQRALQMLLVRLRPLIYRKARRFTQDWKVRVGPSSLTQEVSIGLARLITKVRNTRSSTLLYLVDRLILSKGASAFRHDHTQKRDGGLQPSLEDVAPQLLDEQRSPYEALEHKRRTHRMLVAIAKLDTRQRVALEGTLRGDTPAQIAARLGCSAAAISNLVQRAKQSLSPTKTERAPDALEGALLAYLQQRSLGSLVEPRRFAASYPQHQAELLELLLWLEESRSVWNDRFRI